ncbi:hypothetical protein EYR38_003442 [Pleurotus pulmonarius]|nr:hypothetical protein EYR38_003442 [Pleurotus pulmonarius]
MFFSLASIALLAVSVAAQGECSLTCLDPTQSVNGCGPTDNACLCRDDAFISNTTECINTSCTGDDITNAQAAARSLCAAVGVTLTSTPASAPTSSSSSAAAPPASSTSSGSSSAPTSTAPASSTGSATTSPAPAQTSNAASFNGVNSLAGIAALGLAALAL